MVVNLKKLEKIKDILGIDGEIIVGSYTNYEESIAKINLGTLEFYNNLSRFLKKKKENIIADLKNNKLVKAQSSISFYTLLVPNCENKEEFFILSPYLENYISLEDYQDTLAKQGIGMFDHILDVLYSVPIINKKKFNYFLELLFDTENINFDNIVIYEDLDLKNSKKIIFDKKYVVKNILDKKNKFNKELKEASIKGDITKIMMLFDLEFGNSREDNTFLLGENKLREKGYYINDVLNLIFSDSEANSLDVNSLWVKIKNKLDNYDFSNDIIREYCLLVDKERYKDKQPVVRNCILYINDHIREKISLNEICDSLGVNKSYLSSIFNREMGFSIVDYIHKKRISNAKYLLSNTDFSISEISDYVGYFDTSYFIRIFKTVSGITPLKYRESSTKI